MNHIDDVIKYAMGPKTVTKQGKKVTYQVTIDNGNTVPIVYGDWSSIPDAELDGQYSELLNPNAIARMRMQEMGLQISGFDRSFFDIKDEEGKNLKALKSLMLNAWSFDDLRFVYREYYK